MPFASSKIRYADVPHEPASPRALGPLFRLSNALVLLAHAPMMATTRVHFREPIEELLDEQRPLIWICWHRFNFACTPAMRALPDALRPTLVMHDGARSRAFTHEASAWMGFDTFVFRRRSPVPPRRQLIDYVRASGRPLLNLPDSGGPYGKMKPGILEVAAACDARLVPFTVEARPSLRLGDRLVMPAPFARIELRRGPLLDGNSSLDDCQRALDALE